jgi:hypothetical protein
MINCSEIDTGRRCLFFYKNAQELSGKWGAKAPLAGGENAKCIFYIFGDPKTSQNETYICICASASLHGGYHSRIQAV